MNYYRSIYEHLAKYKVDTLGVTEDGKFRYRDRDIVKPHILPLQEQKLNILPEYRVGFFDYRCRMGIPLHRFFHHLNSSQAMCMNLFYPLIAESALGIVTRHLGLESATDLRGCFEKESEIEQTISRTHFDFHLRCRQITNIFFEVKYTENGFANAKKDEKHKRKFREIYIHLVEKQSEFLSLECRNESFFLDHYQILRNLVHLDKNSFVVFLFPCSNLKVKLDASDAMKTALTDAGRARAKLLHLEDIVAFLETNCPAEPLRNYYRMFRLKYLPGGGGIGTS